MELTDKIVESSLYEGRSYMSKSGRKRWAQHVIWDDSLPGLGLRITPTNRKSFIVTYRAAGRKRTKTLGLVTKITLDEARQRAAELLGSVTEAPPKDGDGPSIQGVTTVAQLANAYLEGYLKKNVPSWFSDQRLMRMHLNPAIGRSPIAEVLPSDLASLGNRVSRRFPADGRRLRVLLEGMFDWAADQGLWTRSSRRARPAARGKKGDSSAPPAETPTASEVEPAPLPSAEELLASLEHSEEQRIELAASLEELSASGVEMLAKIHQQAAANQKLEAELATSRRELERQLAEAADRPSPEKIEKQTDNLRQSVEQLLVSLRAAEEERENLTAKLAEAEARAKKHARKAAEVARQRNELESRALEVERERAIRKAQQRPGSRRPSLLWPAAGLIAGVLLTLLLQSLMGPDEGASGHPAEERGAAAAATPASDSPGSDLQEPPGDLPPVAAGVAAAAGDEAVTDDVTPPTPDPATAAAAVRSWAAAWSEQRVDDYLAAYSTEFQPPQGLRPAEWASRRRNRIQRPARIQVSLDELSQTVVAADRVRVSFRQSYETETFSDQVDKTLELVWEDGAWKIVIEQAS